MKNLLVFLFLLSAALSAHAQCSTYIANFYNPDGSLKLSAFSDDSSGIQIQSYAWSTGTTGSFVTVSNAGNYCVTVTFDNACTATDCFNWDGTVPGGPGGGSACGVNLNVSYAPNMIYASAYPDSTNVTYLWNTGATTAAIPYTVAGNYCVTVTSANACVSDTCLYLDLGQCVVNISESQGALYAQSPQYNGDVLQYLWSTGETGWSIQPTASGNYCVTTTDAAGCTATACADFVYTGGGTGDCFIILTHLPGSGAVIAGFALSGVNATYEIQWSDPAFNGQTYIFPGFDWSQLCVTVTTSSGCNVTDCITNEYLNDCLWGIDAYASLSGHATLTAVVPDPAATVLWNTGETTRTIVVTQAGDYTVSVTSSTGCTDSETKTIYITDKLRVDLCIDNSTFGGNNDIVGELYLIKYDPAQGGILTQVAHVETVNDENFFRLENIPPGDYLIKAGFLPSSPLYSQYLPTYYREAMLWSDAKVIKFPMLLPYQPVPDWPPIAVLCLDEGQNPGGPGFIGGLVSEGANFNGSGADDRDEGDPMAGMSVLLQTLDSIPVTGAFTDANGHFGFGNLAWGTYILTIDVPGLAPVVQIVTIGPDSPSLNISITVDNLNGTTAVQEKPGVEGLLVYPNPVEGQLTVQLKATALLQLSDARGQTIRSLEAKEGFQKMDMSDLPGGVYFLQVQGEAGRETVKVVKK